MDPQQTSRSVVSVLLLMVLIVFGALFYWFVFPYLGSFDVGERQTLPSTGELMQAKRIGDFGKVVSGYEQIQQATDSTVEQRALAAYAALGAQYRLTGDPSKRFDDVRILKEIVTDNRISVGTRVLALNALANQYFVSGGDEALAAEIYKDAPFDQFLVPEDPRKSALRLFEWSYSMMPTSVAAVSIARWYSEQSVFNPKQSADTTKSYVGLAEDYLKKADETVAAEQQKISSYTNSAEYLFYRYWRTVVIGRLAAQKGEPYLSQFRKAYDEFIEFAQTQQNVLAPEYLLYARLFYGAHLAQHRDYAESKTQLDLLAQALNKISDPGANVFVLYLKYEYANGTGGFTWKQLIEPLFKISADFKSAVEKIVATPSQ